MDRNRLIIQWLWDYGWSATSVEKRPHLWVTSGPGNLVYRGYEGNRMTGNRIETHELRREPVFC
jgi:hypothetical protein